MSRAFGSLPAPQAALAVPPERQRAARDLHLIEACLGGRREAFDELVRVYERPVQRILANLSVPPADVDDVEQEVFLRAYRKLSAFRGTATFYAWLHRITVSVALDESKKRRRAQGRLARLQAALAEPSAVRRERYDPHLAYCDHLAGHAMAEAIAELPIAFREVFAMREVEQLSCEEIAGRTGVPGGTVRSRLARARAVLRQFSLRFSQAPRPSASAHRTPRYR